MNSGTKLGPYEILEQLGAGGMGEVWLAHDSRLGRKVAIKVLPEEFAGDPERLARFEQEARAAAALNHPHIAAVFDVGEQRDGADPDAAAVRYMVQEFLEGRNLRELMQDRSRLPLKQALQIAVEVAGALRAAHGAGIVHRDLKPENVFVTTDGHAKILDFGLAKLAEGGPVSDQSATMSPTMLGTMAGQIMGTAGYMAPEQINGENVDGRTDLFAFGCVLYELVTGERAFAGDNVHETLSRILSEDPVRVTEKRRDLPWMLGWIVDKALAKEPTRRYQSAADAVVDLERLRDDMAAGGAGAGAGVAATDGAEASALPAPAAALAALALMVLASGATWWLTRPQPASPPQVQRFDFPTSPAGGLTNLNNRPVAISPAGDQIVLVAGDDGDVGAYLWRRPIDGLEVVQLRNTLEPRSPAFSPDGQELAFWKDPDTIVRMPATGGEPVTVAPLDYRPFGISWGIDGNLWVGGGPRGIYRVPAGGGELEQVLALQEGEAAHGPRLLADGETVLFTLRRAEQRWDEADIVVWSAGQETPRVVMSGGRDPRILPSGHLLYVTNNILMARAMDLSTLEVTGGAVELVDPLPTSGGDLMGGAFYDVSDDGTLVWTTGPAAARAVDLAWIDLATGLAEPLDLDTVPLDHWRLDPVDNRRIAAERVDPSGAEIWVYDIGRGAGQRLSDPGVVAEHPVWSPDGDWIYYSERTEPGVRRVVRRRSDFGGSTEEVISPTSTWADLRPADVSSDGEWLLYIVFEEGSGDEATINRRALGDSGSATDETIARAPAVEHARFSPNGRLIAHTTTGTASAWEIFVHDVGSGARMRVSPEGGRYPTWSADGSHVYYTAGGSEYAVAVHTEPRLRVDAPTTLYNERRLSLEGTQEPALDGERALSGLPDGADSLSSVDRVFVTTNFFEELRRRVLPPR